MIHSVVVRRVTEIPCSRLETVAFGLATTIIDLIPNSAKLLFFYIQPKIGPEDHMCKIQINLYSKTVKFVAR